MTMNEDEIQFRVDLMFGSIELYEAPPRIDGPYLILRSRTIERDRYGKVVRDEISDGCRMTGWEDCAHLFGIPHPPRKSFWNRVRTFLF